MRLPALFGGLRITRSERERLFHKNLLTVGETFTISCTFRYAHKQWAALKEGGSGGRQRGRGTVVDEATLEAFIAGASWEDLAEALRARYQADRVCQAVIAETFPRVKPGGSPVRLASG